MPDLPPGSFTQFNYVTPDIERLMDNWVTTMNAGPFFRWELADPDLIPRVHRGEPAKDTFKACYAFVGTTMLEFMQPTNDAPSMLRETLDIDGEALQHIYPAIRPLDPETFDAISARYVEAGHELVDHADAPVFGRCAFFDATSTVGALIELQELSAASFRMIEMMYEAHVDWDGSAPIRELTDLMDTLVAEGSEMELQEADTFRG